MSNPHIHAARLRATKPVRTHSAPTSGHTRPIVEITRYLGAVSIFVVGAIHAQQYYDDYFYVVPTIGTLFLLNFIGSGVVGVVLIAPVRRLRRNVADLILVLAALGAIGIALGSLVSLLISEYTPFFGFMESGYRLAIVLSLVFDALTTVLLTVFVLTVAHAYRHTKASKLSPARQRTASDHHSQRQAGPRRAASEQVGRISTASRRSTSSVRSRQPRH